MVFIWTRNNVVNSAVGLVFFPLLLFFAFPVQAVDVDTDSDGLSNIMEKIYYTDSANHDTDGDGYMDGLEVTHGYSPHSKEGLKLTATDYDEDGLSDFAEIQFQTDMGQKDTDTDGFSDFEEVMAGFNPTSRDSARAYPQRIVIDLSRQQLQYRVHDVVIKEFPVSTGRLGRQTPTGSFTVERKIPVKRYTGPNYDYKNVKWNLQFKPQYYIHTAYWHNDFGILPRSAGCINMREKDVELLYGYIDVGVPVDVVGKTPFKALPRA